MLMWRWKRGRRRKGGGGKHANPKRLLYKGKSLKLPENISAIHALHYTWVLKSLKKLVVKLANQNLFMYNSTSTVHEKNLKNALPKDVNC